MKLHAHAGAVVALSIAVVTGCAGDAPAPADSPQARAELAQSIAELEIAGGSYEQTLDLGAELALESSEEALADELGRALTEAERTGARKVMREALAGIVSTEAFRTAVVEAYAERFTADELQSISRFFASPAGSRLLAEQPALTEAIGSRMESIVDANLEQFGAAVDAGVAREFGEAAGEDAG